MRSTIRIALITMLLVAGVAGSAELVYVDGGGTIWGQRAGGLSFGLGSDETEKHCFRTAPDPSIMPFISQSQATVNGGVDNATLTVRHGFDVTTPEPDELMIQTFTDVLCSAGGSSFLYVADRSEFPWPDENRPAYAHVWTVWPGARTGIDYVISPTAGQAVGDPVTVTAGIWHQVTTSGTGGNPLPYDGIGVDIDATAHYAKVLLNGVPVIDTSTALHGTGSLGGAIFDANVGDVITYDTSHSTDLYCNGFGVEGSAYLRSRSELTATFVVDSEPPGDSIETAIMPYGRDADGTWHFPCMTITDEEPPGGGPPLGLHERPIWIDPSPATGFDYEVTGVPLAAVTLEASADSDACFDVWVWNEGLGDYELVAPGWDFSESPTYDFMVSPPDGVYRFRITGIDPPADGDDPTSFPTGLSFVEPGDVTSLTMTPIPEPAALVLLGVGGLAMLRRRR